MSNDNVTILPLSAHAARYIANNYDFGELVSNTDLYELLEVSEPAEEMPIEEYKSLNFRRLSLVEDTKKRLLDDFSVYFVNKRSEGYLLVKPNEQTEVAVDIMKNKMKKHARKANSALKNIRSDLLNEKERQENLNARSQMSSIKSMLRSQMKKFVIGLPSPIEEND